MVKRCSMCGGCTLFRDGTIRVYWGVELNLDGSGWLEAPWHLSCLSD
jgi:hypothetical protein